MDIEMMHKRLNKILALFLGALTYLVCAQNVSAQYRFDRWTTDNGLPQNSIINILQTADGFLWMTTFDGLVRYDGVRFRVFNPGNTRGIKSSRFLRLFEDRNKNLWITTAESGITCYRNGLFTTYTTEDGLPHNRISRGLQLREDDEGVVINTDGGPIRWQDGKLVPYRPDGGDRFATVGFPARPGVVWIIDGAGLHRVENAQVTTHLPSRWSSPAEVRKITETGRGTVWVTVTLEGKVWRLRDGVYTLVTGNDGKALKGVVEVYEDRHGNIWIATAGSGLYRLGADRATVFTAADGLLSNQISTIFEDLEGNLWIGTSKGLNRIRERIITAYSQNDGLAANNIYPICQDRSGAIWIGSWKGISRYHEGTFTDYSKTFGLENYNVTALCEDREGSLWIATWGGKLRQIRGGKITAYDDVEVFKDNAVHAIYQERAGTLWFGTHNGLILYRNGSFTAFGKKDGLSGETVFCIFEDRGGTLWIGTELGLTSYSNGRFRAYTTADGFSGYIVRSLYQDADDVLWIGTYDGGLNRLKGEKFTNYTMRDGLFNNGVFQILEDGRDNFWMSCNLGIYRVSKKELNDFAEGRTRSITSVSYGKQDGMLSQECNGGNQPAGIKAADGRLWFPTLEGVAAIDPLAVPINTQPPPVVIEDVAVGNEQVIPGEAITILPGKENFDIAYTALSFIGSEQIKFKYKLEGFDSDWIEAGARRTAFYTRVPPGTYTFVVTAANRDGVWNVAGAKLRVIVVPPFWRTWWFLVLILSVLVTATVLLYARRISALKRAHQVQETFSRQLIESQESERKRIAAELHDSLAQNLLVVKNRVLLAMRASAGDARSREHLNEASAATDQAIDEVSEISYNLRPHQLDNLGLGRAIEAMLDRVSGSSGILFSAEIDPLDGLFPPQDETSLYRIIQECVNNIVKHSQANEARIAIKTEARAISLTIQDNGRGFDLEARVADRSRTSGFGLTGIAERTRMLGGKLVIESVPGSGTLITAQIELLRKRDEYRDHHPDSRRSSVSPQGPQRDDRSRKPVQGD
jgi:signal transduction histidine kinase/ligand-binding sensor domain-containing protein